MPVLNIDGLLSLFDLNSSGSSYDANSKFRVLGRGIFKGAIIEVRNTNTEIWLTPFDSNNSQGLLTTMSVDLNITSKFTSIGKNYVCIFSKQLMEQPSQLSILVYPESQYLSLSSTDFLEICGTIEISSLSNFSDAKILYEERSDLIIERSPIRGGIWNSVTDILNYSLKKEGDMFVHKDDQGGVNLLVFDWNRTLRIITGDQLAQALTDHRANVDDTKHVTSEVLDSLTFGTNPLDATNQVLKESDPFITTKNFTPEAYYAEPATAQDLTDIFKIAGTVTADVLFNLESVKEQIQVLNPDSLTPMWDSDNRRITVREVWSNLAHTVVFDPTDPAHIIGGMFIELRENIENTIVPQFAISCKGTYADVIKSNITPRLYDFTGDIGTVFEGLAESQSRNQVKRFIGHWNKEHGDKLNTTIKEIVTSEFANLDSSMSQLLYEVDTDSYVWKKNGVRIPYTTDINLGDAQIDSITEDFFNVNMAGALNAYTAVISGGIPFYVEWKVFIDAGGWVDVTDTEIPSGEVNNEGANVIFTAPGDYKIECSVISYQGNTTSQEILLSIISSIPNETVGEIIGDSSFFISSINNYDISTSDNSNCAFSWSLFIGEDEVTDEYLTVGGNDWEVIIVCGISGSYTLKIQVRQLDNGNNTLKEKTIVAVQQLH